jgi:Mrp family chromosome partitioning ATPase
MQKILSKLKNLTVVTGHFGSGKTNFAVNLARFAAKEGRKVTIIDLDIVNPYFRAADN